MLKEQISHVRDPARARTGDLRVELIIIDQGIQTVFVAFGVGFAVHHAGVAHGRIGTPHGHAVVGQKKTFRLISCVGLLELVPQSKKRARWKDERVMLAANCALACTWASRPFWFDA
eukprot:scaffold849_cov386-Pavlova_lutheri.AAC.4